MAETRVVIGKCPKCAAAPWFTKHWYLTGNEPVRCWVCNSADLELTPVLLDPTARGEPLMKLPELDNKGGLRCLRNS